MTDATSTSQTVSVPPGSTIGVLGGGQLGRMMTHVAQRLGYRVAVFDPDDDAPAGRAADWHYRSKFDNAEAIADFAALCDVVTLEFENVPTAAVEQIEQTTPVRPGSAVLAVAQNRVVEKTRVRDLGLATADFAVVDDVTAFAEAVSQFANGSVAKTVRMGYDGHGQAMVAPNDDLTAAWKKLTGFQQGQVIVEERIDLAGEISVLAVRGVDGQTAVYPPVWNEHSNHILSLSVSPWPDATSTQIEAAQSAARTIVEGLDVVGVMCVEFFVTTAGDLLVNEVAPRPHNSGHLTIEAFECSQFEQQVRAVCGLPLGSTAMRSSAAMVNLLGDVWQHGEPSWVAVLDDPSVGLHLYGKAEARPARKMGHITVLGENAAARAAATRERLMGDTQTT